MSLLELLTRDDTTEMVEDVFVSDGPIITRSRAPRTNKERHRVQYHDCRTRQERESDPRTAKQIVKGESIP